MDDKIVPLIKTEMCIKCFQIVRTRVLRVRESLAFLMNPETFFEGKCHKCGYDSLEEED